MITHSSVQHKTTIFYNHLDKDNLLFLNNFEFKKKDYDTDVVIRNIFAISHYHMLLLISYYELLPQYISNSQIIFKVLNFISYCDDKDIM